MSAEVAHLQTVAAWLRLGRRVDAVSRLLLLATLLAGIAWLCWPQAGSSACTRVGLAIAWLAGLVQCVYAARVQFDADLFAQAAMQARESDADSARDDLDAALLQLGLLPMAKAGRDWPERVAGARRLLRRQCQWHLAQWLAFVVALIGAVTATLGR